MIQHLQNEMCCVSVDFRGHGEIDVPGKPFSLDDLVDVGVELMRVRQLTNAIVVGCSMGGMVAQGVAAKVPELLSGLVIAGTGHAQTPQSGQAMQALLPRSTDVEVPGAGHLAPMEQPEAFGSILRDFINRQVGQG